MLCGIAQDAAVSVVFALFILPNGLWTCGCGQDGVRVDEAVCTGSKGGLSSLLAETVGTWEPPPHLLGKLVPQYAALKGCLHMSGRQKYRERHNQPHASRWGKIETEKKTIQFFLAKPVN